MTWTGLHPPYATLVADPPWPTGAKNSGYICGIGRRYGHGGRRRRATSLLYSTMPVEDIAALPVGELAAEDAHLYLWVPAGFNREGYGVFVARAWGFQPTGEIVWAKKNYGMGAFPRPQHEILLVCRMGKLPFARRDIGSVVFASQERGSNNGGKVHSAKPPAVYDVIEAASPAPRVELFARQPRLGWDSWGDGFESREVVEA